MNIVRFKDHLINMENVVEIKWYDETSEVVMMTTDSEYIGIAATKADFDKLAKSFETK